MDSASDRTSQADLLITLYEARREQDLRRARRWFEDVFEGGNSSELTERYPKGSEGERYLRMILGYWQMVAAIWKGGGLAENLLFPTTSEFVAVWDSLEAYAVAQREGEQGNPKFCRELEEMAEAYRAWLKA